MGVDVATYKAEFLSHHYEGKRRPLNHYAFGHIDRWARIASRYSRALRISLRKLRACGILRNLLADRTAADYSPAFARTLFASWFARAKTRDIQQPPPVVLWPDTFNNYFHPETAIAAVEVLEPLGFQVRLPAGHVCCGRPLYDFGMLDRAKKLL